ncbi:DUF4175 family protein [Novispirillum itersonii]|uniref:DUF4175 family protein n=1 Tax=Novispirillum itersonii TaxID=189 RepID=UPI0009DBAFED|nr:DUF4175 family protein [Novispirillum itersonii]
MTVPEMPPDPSGMMTDAGADPGQTVPPRESLSRRLPVLQLLIALERFWLESWAVRAMLVMGLAVLLSGWLPLLPGWIHLTLLLVAAGLLLGAVWRMGQRLCWPGQIDAIRRWEGRARHRPLTASFDRLSQGGDPLTEALWVAHKVAARRQVASLSLSFPDPQIAVRDPLGLRVIPVLALVVALVAGWHDPLRRITEGMAPALNVSGDPVTLDVWLTPPSYTGLPPLTRSLTVQRPGVGEEEAVKAWQDLFAVIPAGTAVQMLVRSGGSLSLQMAGQDVPVQHLDAGVVRWDGVLSAPGVAEIAIGSYWRTWLRWPVKVLPDQPPSLAWTAPPTVSARSGGDGALLLPLQGDDDWGFTALLLEMQRAGEAGEALPLPLSGQPRALRSALSLMLSGHPWAGLEVQVRVRGRDGAGQEEVTEWAPVTLPERAFTHPVARQIILLRKALMTEGPTGLAAVGIGLAHLSSQPDDFGQDPVLFLGLRIAALRTAFAAGAAISPPDRRGLAGLLWNLAIRVEDGGLSGARETLEQARQALADAVASKVSPAELQAAIAAVRQAASAYINELLTRMESDGTPLPALSGLALSADSIDRMAQALEELTRLGSAEAAQQMMEQLSRALSRLQAATPDVGQMQAVARTVEALKQIVREQEGLLQETFGVRQDEPIRRKNTPSRYAGRGQELAESQQQLAARLRALSATLSPDPAAQSPSLTAAGVAMGQAEAALRTARWDAAMEAEAEALSALKKGQGEALESLLQGGGMPLLLMPGGTGLSEDPTGRGGESLGPAGQAIPDKPQRAKAWDLLQELRRRASDRSRPQEEREYLERLLKLF